MNAVIRNADKAPTGTFVSALPGAEEMRNVRIRKRKVGAQFRDLYIALLGKNRTEPTNLDPPYQVINRKRKREKVWKERNL